VREAKLPTKSRTSDAGLDLYIIKKELIPSNTIRVMQTGLAVQIPDGWYGQVLERSGFSSANTLKLKAGVIDSNYRGEIKLVFQNCGDYPVKLEAGAKVAQLVLLPVPEVTVVEVTNLEESDRGEQGFGSSDAPTNT
jgi:dUTP pyrophosphatase